MIKAFFLSAFLFIVSAVQAQELPAWKLSDLQAAIKSDKPTILNFWATFCKPCIEEIPHFQEMAKKYEKQGVQLILVSLDPKDAFPQKIKTFVQRRGFTARMAFLDETNADIFCPAVDESWSGAIPATLFINNKTGYRKFYEEQLSKEQLEKEIVKLLGE
jgi:thiol-disulfide isomerase/thioredoxin